MFSGAYYKYDMYRTLVLFTYEKRKVLISISKQKDVSQVGNKGYILGSDDNWDYFYSGKPGLTIPGLGWVRSYMYDSYGINVYYQIDENNPVVRCATLRWIKAGWAKINVVKSHHIHAGLKRFAARSSAAIRVTSMRRACLARWRATPANTDLRRACCAMPSTLCRSFSALGSILHAP